jgi:hypothetical protein
MNNYFTIFLVAFSSLSIAETAQTMGTHTYHYDLMAEALDVGDITIKIVGQADGSYVVAESTSVEAEGWWGDISEVSTKIENYSPDGRFLNADVKTLNGKKVYWRKAVLSGDELWASYTQVENVSEKEEGEFLGTAVAVASNLVGGLGNVLAVTQLLFSDSNAPLDNLRIPANMYDTSFANLPFYWSSNEYNLPAELKLFDSSTLEINTYQLEYIGTETFQQGSADSAVVASHFKFVPETGADLEVWLAVSNNAPYFYQLAGADEDGPFQILLTQR